MTPSAVSPPADTPAPPPRLAPQRAPMKPRPIAARMLLLAMGGFGLLAGLDAALLQLGVGAPVTSDRVSSVHGMLMVLGFVGTLIALERAVALARPWGFLAPAFMGIGGIALVSPLPLYAAGLLLMAGTGIQMVMFIPLWRRRRDAAVLVQSIGAASAFGGAVLFTGGADAPAYLGWLVGFVVLLIAGERMELARLGRSDNTAEQIVLLSAVVLLVSIVLALLFPVWGPAILGFALLVMVAALLNVDVARRMWRSQGLPRFSALCLLGGYLWLTVAGAILLLVPEPLVGGAYDAVVHSVMLGFTMSMIFAHAAVILPAVLRRPLPYHPIMYAAAILLHVALAVRIVGGDLINVRWVWQAGGIGNVIAVAGFVATSLILGVTASIAARMKRTRAAQAAAPQAIATGD